MRVTDTKIDTGVIDHISITCTAPRSSTIGLLKFVQWMLQCAFGSQKLHVLVIFIVILFLTLQTLSFFN